ncbi:Crp/Fnr family transcriptional regulator [Chitinophaga sp. MM2321]|uniref:Crp/Fnr family transcriptional regulator n=1 Tax=Chitinophaga sp. MM2321 TaxID=3137178 RepID=UPI0032D571DC
MSAMNNPVLEMISQIIPVTEAFVVDFTSRLQYRSLTKNAILLRQGTICNHMHFVIKGLLRSYYEVGFEDVTNWFLMENDLVISLLSFYRRQPSFETIEALEDCELISIHHDDLMELYGSHVEFNVIGRVLTTEYYCKSEENMLAMRKHNAAEKYKDLMERSPEIIKRVPNKYIASYLSMSEETLSRIKSSHL